jgi:DNA repair protein RadC
MKRTESHERSRMIKDLEKHNRPREKLLAKGASALSDFELPIEFR